MVQAQSEKWEDRRYFDKLLNEFLKEHRKVEKQQGTIVELKTSLAQQQNEIKVLTAGLERVSNQLEVTKPAGRATKRGVDGNGLRQKNASQSALCAVPSAI